MKKLLLVCSILFANSAFASECFDAQFARSWSYDGKKEVLSVEVMRDIYEIKTYGSCYELGWADTIGFRTIFGSQVCSGDRVLVYDNFGRLAQVCSISDIVKAK